MDERALVEEVVKSWRRRHMGDPLIERVLGAVEVRDGETITIGAACAALEKLVHYAGFVRSDLEDAKRKAQRGETART